MLEVKEVWKTFNAGTVNEKQALRGVNLTLNDGDFCTVIGGNGAGKSTLLNAVAGTFPVDAGDHLPGRRGRHPPAGAQAGHLYRPGVPGPHAGHGAHHADRGEPGPGRPAGQEPGLRWGITKAEREDYIQRLKILDLGLEDRLTSKVGLLSGGQRQALTLLMATLIKPQLLLLDEHTAALDPKTAAKVLDATDRLVRKDNLTTLMITHNMKDAIAHGNRLIMMYDGRVVIDVSGEDKKKLTVPQLLELFSKVSGSDEADDKLLLS